MPECRRIIDGQVIIRDNKVYMRKRCPEHGWFEGLIYSDAEAYTASVKFNKPGTIPLEFSTDVIEGCPYDCGLCPEHKQHACLGIIEVNSACNFDCPLCFADAQSGFNLTLEEVDRILDRFIETEGQRRSCSSPAASQPSIRRSSRCCASPRTRACRT